VQQVRFSGNYKSEFMIIALAITAVAALVMTLIKERKIIQKQSPLCYSLGVICGAANGAVNLLVMILSGRMPVSLMFPIISAGGIVATFIISTVFYKEKLSRPQLVGFILGTVSVVLLNF
jgi:multidrug transporter EmrE-like cation transporter